MKFEKPIVKYLRVMLYRYLTIQSLLASAGAWNAANGDLTIALIKNVHVNYCMLPKESPFAARNAIRKMSEHFILSVSASPKIMARMLNETRQSTLLVSLKGIHSLRQLQQEGLTKRLPPQVKWLVETDVEQWEASLYIPIDCDFWLARTQPDSNYILSGVYHVTPTTQHIRNVYAIINKNNKDLMEMENFSKGKLNLQGVSLIVYVPLADPCYYVLACVHYHLVSDFAMAHNFTRNDVSTEDLEKYHGGKFDIVANIAAFHTLSNYQDMLGPVLHAEMYMFLRDSYGTHAEYWTSYFLPFENLVWVALFGFVIFSSLVIATMQYCSEETDIISSAFIPLDAISYQGTSIPSKSFFGRWSMLMPRVLCAVLYPAYSAAIIAFLTVKITTLPFTDIKGFHLDGTYRLGSLKLDSFATNYFQMSGNKDMQDIGERLQLRQDKLLITYEENIKWICRDGKFVFLTYNTLLDNYNAPCKIISIPTSVTSTFTGLTLFPNSPLKSIFKTTLLNMYASGVLNRRNAISRAIEVESKVAFQPIEQLDVTVPLILLMSGIALSLVFFQAEILYCELSWRIHRKAGKVRIRRLIGTFNTPLDKFRTNV